MNLICLIREKRDKWIVTIWRISFRLILLKTGRDDRFSVRKVCLSDDVCLKNFINLFIDKWKRIVKFIWRRKWKLIHLKRLVEIKSFSFSMNYFLSNWIISSFGSEEMFHFFLFGQTLKCWKYCHRLHFKKIFSLDWRRSHNASTNDRISTRTRWEINPSREDLFQNKKKSSSLDYLYDRVNLNCRLFIDFLS